MRPHRHLQRIVRLANEPVARDGFLRLDKNENNCPYPPAMLAGLRRAMTASWLSSYPEPWRLQQALARVTGVPESMLYLVSGSDAGIKSAFEVFVRPGDPVVFAEPGYAMYRVYAELFRARPVTVQYDRRLRLDVDRLCRSITRRTALVLLANPNSPTGTVLAPRDLRRVADRARRCGVPLLLDEAYYPFYPHSFLPLLSRYPNVMVTRTFSKAYGLAAARLGVVYAAPQLITLLQKYRPLYEINGFAVAAGLAVLRHPAWVQRTTATVVRNREWLRRAVRILGYAAPPSQANFVNIRVGATQVPALVARLRAEKILVRACAHPALADCVRVSIGTLAMMRRVRDCLARWQRGKVR